MTIGNDVARFAEGQNDAPPPRLGQRLDAERFLPEAGNTVVCHLDFTASGHEAVLRARSRMQALPGAERFLFTPEASLHMTVFEGVIETQRVADAWPAGIDRDVPVEVVTQALLPRLSEYAGPGAFAVRAKDMRPTGLALEGVTAADREMLQAWRDTLTMPFGFRRATHDAYGFHMTFAYPTAWLPDDLIPVWQSEIAAIFSDLVDEAPVLPLRPPAFCRFADMTHFEELVVL